MSQETEYPPLPRGVLTVSIDLELAWGFCDQLLDERRLAAIRRERQVVPRLIELFARHGLRATWAIVAHLLVAHGRRDARGLPHPDFPRPVRRGEKKDHFFQLPSGERDPAWWGADLIAQIRAARPRHEIGSHSFCHLLYEEGATAPPAVEADLDAARRLHDEAGLPFDAFVYPRNVVGFRPLLERAGVKVYRDVTPRWYAALRPLALRRAARLATYFLGMAPPTVRPRRRGGLVALGDSMLLLGRDGPRRWVPARRLIEMARAGMTRAAERREVFHLWFHPSNLVARREEQLATLEAILSRGRALVDAGRLDNRVMGHFANPGAAAMGGDGGGAA